MTSSDFLQITLSAAGAALAAGLAAALILRLARRAPLFVHVLVIVAAAIAAVAGGIALTAQGMYISDADTAVALAVTGASGVVSLAMAVVLATGLSRDARRLGRDARRLGAGEAVAPASRVTAELDAVQGDLVDSSERLEAARADSERAEQARRDLVTRIAHDLLAPLASIRAISETLEDGMSAEPDRHARLLSAHVTRLHALVGDLFELSRIDAGTLQIAAETVSLTDLASDVVAEFSDLAHRNDVHVSFHATAGVTAQIDPREVSRALINVLVNAIEHSPPGGTVRVTAHAETDEWATIVIDDDGPGITEADLPHLFEAGWRGSSARTSPRVELAGGAGLGLAITRAITRAHGGDATADNTGSGARFTLRLPRR